MRINDVPLPPSHTHTHPLKAKLYRLSFAQNRYLVSKPRWAKNDLKVSLELPERGLKIIFYFTRNEGATTLVIQTHFC